MAPTSSSSLTSSSRRGRRLRTRPDRAWRLGAPRRPPDNPCTVTFNTRREKHYVFRVRLVRRRAWRRLLDLVFTCRDRTVLPCDEKIILEHKCFGAFFFTSYFSHYSLWMTLPCGNSRLTFIAKLTVTEVLTYEEFTAKI